jgi:hypothetical protein
VETVTRSPGARQAFQWPVAKARLKACLRVRGLPGWLRKNVLAEETYVLGRAVELQEGGG